MQQAPRPKEAAPAAGQANTALLGWRSTAHLARTTLLPTASPSRRASLVRLASFASRARRRLKTVPLEPTAAQPAPRHSLTALHALLARIALSPRTISGCALLEAIAAQVELQWPAIASSARQASTAKKGPFRRLIVWRDVTRGLHRPHPKLLACSAIPARAAPMQERLFPLTVSRARISALWLPQPTLARNVQQARTAL